MDKRRRLRGSIAFMLACFASPCCTPLIIPLLIALLAGSPIALWMSQNLGWVYGGLTVISIVSFVLAWRWLNRPKVSQTPIINLSNIPVMPMPTIKGDQSHVQ